MEIVSLAERPELEQELWELASVWPEFMLNDPIADLYYSKIDRWADWVFIAIDADEIAARAFSVPFAMGESIGRDGLPDDGWDGVVRWSWEDTLYGREPTTVSALEIGIEERYRGSGLAVRLIEAMARNAFARGHDALVAPVRPTRKHLEPRTPMQEYIGRMRPDGLPVDPWLRVHARLGAELVGVCPTSMTIPGTLDEWRMWTGLPFDQSGQVVVPGALVPVHVSVEDDHAVYVEPNVWMAHRR